MSDDGIDKSGDADAVKQVTHEAGSANHRARSNRRAGIGESELEDPHRQERYPRSLIGCWRVLQKESVIADEPVAVSKHERKTDGVEQNAAQTCIHYAFHQYVHRFTRTTETSFQHGETDLHTENQKRSHQGPGGVDWVHHVGGFYFRSASLCVHMGKENS